LIVLRCLHLIPCITYIYRKGAFTDAKEDRAGFFEQANGGTLFLDEVSNLSLEIQAKLLRVLEEGKIRRIGEARERKDDIPLLVQHFVEEYSIQRKKKVQGITNQALSMLWDYDWPGNVRQLMNEIERAVILMENGWITPAHFSATVKRGRSESGEKSFTIQQIIKALKENNWVKRKAARALGIPESTLRRRLKVNRIEVPTKS